MSNSAGIVKTNVNKELSNNYDTRIEIVKCTGKNSGETCTTINLLKFTITSVVGLITLHND